MAGKRSRIHRSSSSGNTSVISGFEYTDRPPLTLTFPAKTHSPIAQKTSPGNNWPVIFRNMSPEYHRPAILAISAPEIDPVDQMWDGLVPFGRFFEKCFYCKKKISDDEEVFMYSNLRAFCTDACRTKQIEMEVDLKRLSASSWMMKSGKRR
ncbi:hypothetical protein BVRB_5g119650 [Beta vulgaris subsp. vulgaris]|uniref:uncharacterized protein LOC104894530 n=1 Tax=Beta vulgaris subsp. vulgaris TaxID=3555 RepID=UPI00053FACAF|nr:uncharacterized protein LOC104894530 [Beta vulgaris subsp. vulgaris]KMT10204.1 hypothetical protein BVRB_5g119650 [Beta vulgaris subsp. vulgaris]